MIGKSMIIKSGLIIAACLFFEVPIAFGGTEAESNDTPAQANSLPEEEIMDGSIDPIADKDYFVIPGVNTGWGFIALVDTSESTTSKTVRIRAFDNSGTTLLQSDIGSWEKGSGIALQNFSDDEGLSHYLSVNEVGNDSTVSLYHLRYYETITDTQPELESNNNKASATPSSFTMAGTIDPVGDIDYYAFQGGAGDNILLALNGDPEGDGSPVDLVLKLRDPSGTVIATADVTGAGGKEFIEYLSLPTDGIYCYTVRDNAGGGSSTGTYKVGIVRNGDLYFPSYTENPQWVNPPPDNKAHVNNNLIFKLSITNNSPILIPGNINHSLYYPAENFTFVSVSPAETSKYPGYVSWIGQKSGLNPGETYFVTATLKATAPGSVDVMQNTSVPYFFYGSGLTINVVIEPSDLSGILPLLLE
jgi:hypothetical protein